MGPPRVMVPCHYSSSHWAVSLYKVLIWYLQYFISNAPETIYDRQTDRQTRRWRSDPFMSHLLNKKRRHKNVWSVKGAVEYAEHIFKLCVTAKHNLYIFHVEKAILILNMFNYCTCQILLQTELLETPWVMPPSL